MLMPINVTQPCCSHQQSSSLIQHLQQTAPPTVSRVVSLTFAKHNAAHIGPAAEQAWMVRQHHKKPQNQAAEPGMRRRPHHVGVTLARHTHLTRTTAPSANACRCSQHGHPPLPPPEQQLLPVAASCLQSWQKSQSQPHSRWPPACSASPSRSPPCPSRPLTQPSWAPASSNRRSSRL